MEQGLPGYAVCNLGAVNLAKVANGWYDRPTAKTEFKNKELEVRIKKELLRFFSEERAEFFLYHINWELLEEITRVGLRFQDAIIDSTFYPFDANRKQQLAERRVGLGIMGLHDLMLLCGVEYGSEESDGFSDVVMGMIAEWCYLESAELAKENGPFPNYKEELFLSSGYMAQMAERKPHVIEVIKKYGVRNVTNMTIAPTGTTGTMVGISTGCEPYFAWEYFRNSRLGMFMEAVDIVRAYREAHDHTEKKYTKGYLAPGQVEIMPEELKGKTKEEIEEYREGTYDEFDDLPSVFVTAMSLTPEQHVRVQAALQRWIDSSISKTCNAPSDYKVEDVKALYEKAYELGCKGVTIYRDQSRDTQVLETKREDKKGKDVVSSQEEVAVMAEQVSEEPRVEYVKKARNNPLYGATYKKKTPMGTAYITINDDPETGLARELFVNIGKAGSDIFAMSESLGRALTLFLKDSPNPNKEAAIVKHFSGVGGQNTVGFGPNKISSVADAVAKALMEHAETFPLRELNRLKSEAAEKEEERVQQAELPVQEVVAASKETGLTAMRRASIQRDICPECNQMTLVKKAGCNECENCGFSKC